MVKSSFLRLLNNNLAKLMSKNMQPLSKLDIFNKIYNQWAMIATMQTNFPTYWALLLSKPMTINFVEKNPIFSEVT